MIFRWSELFPHPDDLAAFQEDLYRLARSLYDLTDCPQAYEDQTDFIEKLLIFIKDNEHQIDYIRQILEVSDEDNTESSSG